MKWSTHQQPLGNLHLDRQLGARLLGVSLIGATVMLVSPAEAATTLSAWQFDPVARQFTITLPAGVTPRFLVAAEPARIILEIPQSQLGNVVTQQRYDGAVQSVQLLQAGPDTVHAVLTFAPNTVLDPHHAQLTAIEANGQTRWLLTPLVADPGMAVASTPTPSVSSSPGELPQLPSLPPASQGELDPSAAAATTPDAAPPVASTSPPSTAPSSTNSPAGEMIVELPVIPAPQPNLAFPDEGEGRLSTTAANLMLPEDVANLQTLPETLPIDPFAISIDSGGADNTPVSVPSLAELDAATGPVATAPTSSTSPQAAAEDASQVPEIPSETVSAPVVTIPEVPSGITSAAVVPESASPANPAVASAPADPSVAEPVVVVPDPSAVIVAEAAPSLPTASEPFLATTEAGVDIPIEPPAEEAGADPMVADAPETTTPTPTDVIATNPPNPASQTEMAEPLPEATTLPEASPQSPSADAAPIPAEPPEEIAVESTPAPEMNVQEPATTSPLSGNSATAAAESVVAPQAVAAIPPAVPPTVVVPNNASATASPAAVPPESDLLTVPVVPETTSTETVVPPEVVAEPEPVLLAGTPITFGQPLPAAGSKAVDAEPLNQAQPVPNSDVPPDVLIAAGTVLELRYPGYEPLVLEPDGDLNEVLLLENDILDPITGGIVAPAGSQLIGQFETNREAQQWTSRMLIVPSGARVPFTSQSEYMLGTPQVNGGRLALGTGIGALALGLLTGFGGIGLIGGAVVGATTMVGTAPQEVVLQPNEIIYVQVMESVPRAMPIAAGPDQSREWMAE
jgi:hypothetical protein